MKVINLTPHLVKIIGVGETGEFHVIPTGQVARCAEERVDQPPIGGIPVTSVKWGELVNLPLPEEGTIYIVSALAAQAAWAKGRRDVLSPGPLVRGEDGQPIGCRGLTGPSSQ